LKMTFVKTNRITNACFCFLNIDAARLQISPRVGLKYRLSSNVFFVRKKRVSSIWIRYIFFD